MIFAFMRSLCSGFVECFSLSLIVYIIFSLPGALFIFLCIILPYLLVHKRLPKRWLFTLIVIISMLGGYLICLEFIKRNKEAEFNRHIAEAVEKVNYTVYTPTYVLHDTELVSTSLTNTYIGVNTRETNELQYTYWKKDKNISAYTLSITKLPESIILAENGCPIIYIENKFFQERLEYCEEKVTPDSLKYYIFYQRGAMMGVIYPVKDSVVLIESPYTLKDVMQEEDIAKILGGLIESDAKKIEYLSIN